MAVVTRSIKDARRHLGGGRHVAKIIRQEKRIAHRANRRTVRHKIRTSRYDNLSFDEPRLTAWDID